MEKGRLVQAALLFRNMGNGMKDPNTSGSSAGSSSGSLT